MSIDEGVKHGDEDEHIHESAHQITIHFKKGIGTLMPPLIRHLFVSSNTKLSSKDKTNPRERKREKEKDNLHKVAKLKIFFQIDVKACGNPTRKTHRLKVPFLIIHCN
jgi:hypothetical protein